MSGRVGGAREGRRTSSRRGRPSCRGAKKSKHSQRTSRCSWRPRVRPCAWRRRSCRRPTLRRAARAGGWNGSLSTWSPLRRRRWSGNDRTCLRRALCIVECVLAGVEISRAGVRDEVYSTARRRWSCKLFRCPFTAFHGCSSAFPSPFMVAAASGGRGERRAADLRCTWRSSGHPGGRPRTAGTCPAQRAGSRQSRAW